MLKRDKALLGLTIGVAVLDLGLMWGTYMKKKGVVVRDMVIKAIDDQIYRKDGDSERKEIPIE